MAESGWAGLCRRGSILIAALLFAIVGGGEASAATLVVVSNSVGIGYQRGTELQDGAEINVPAGEELALIDSNGNGVTVRGPYRGPLHAHPAGAGAASDPELLKTLKKILRPGQTQAMGAERGILLGGRPPDAASIDLSIDVTQCMPLGQPVKLWRRNAVRVASVSLMLPDSGERVELTWPAGAATLAWPKEVPLVEGKHYVVQFRAGPMQRFQLAFLPAGVDPSIDFAQRLAERGCQAQAVAMLERIADAAPRP